MAVLLIHGLWIIAAALIGASTELIEDVTIWKSADPVHVTGFAGRYEKIREIMPRISSDLKKAEAD